MKIISSQDLPLSGTKIISFARFGDNRGYFTETFRRSDVVKMNIDGLSNREFVQGNESFSRKNVIRGLHFQWNPYMGKLVRTVRGHMVDIILDIRKGSPTEGKVYMQDMPANEAMDKGEWIWVPPGFAHGNFFKEDTIIEYLCTGEYSQGCEAGVSPLSSDLDWSLSDAGLRKEFQHLVKKGAIISDKDKAAPNLADWMNDKRSDNFRYEDLK